MFFYATSMANANPFSANNPSYFVSHMGAKEKTIVSDACDCPPLIINRTVNVTVSNLAEDLAPLVILYRMSDNLDKRNQRINHQTDWRQKFDLF